MLGATRRYSALLGATRRYPALLGATRRYSALLGATRRYSALLGATRRYSALSALPGATRRSHYAVALSRRMQCNFRLNEFSLLNPQEEGDFDMGSRPHKTWHFYRHGMISQNQP